jgi:hypothetical protein
MVMSEQLPDRQFLNRIAVLAALTADDPHARPEEIEALVAGTATSEVQSRIEDHLRDCPMCAAEVADLRQLAQGGSRTRRYVLAAAAAILVAALAVPLFLIRSRNAADVRLAAAALPTEIVAMRGERLQLRGAWNESALSVLEPIGTAVASDRPVFRWKAAPGVAVSVQIFDEGFRPLMKSEPTTAHEWTPSQTLPRGRTLVWQIVSEDASGRTIAPRPPLPEARFRVISESAARRIAAIAREDSDPTLRLASAYVEAGALDDARRELQRLAAAGRMNDASRTLLEKIDNLR